METLVRTPQDIFSQPQILRVPLFQRPYVWNQEAQWEPLWEDLTRVADDVVRGAPTSPHFLGAVVLQQSANSTGSMQERSIIDGQQRLTTYQLLLDALHTRLLDAGEKDLAADIEVLVSNDQRQVHSPGEQFKVRPTHRDQAAFDEVMSAVPPVIYEQLAGTGTRMAQAHRYFAEAVGSYLGSKRKRRERAQALVQTVRRLVTFVVIDLGVDENSQEIFETLNSRGTPLTPADLIKNFVFQRLRTEGADDKDTADAYDTYWRDFENGFWEQDISAGRTHQQRASVFLGQWLVARTGEEIRAKDAFPRFKRYVNAQPPKMDPLMSQIHDAAGIYQTFVISGQSPPEALDRLALFSYRTSVLESEVVKPLVICLTDPAETPVPDKQLVKALDSIESWMVRRMLIRATSKSYTQIIADLIGKMRSGGRERAGDVVEDFLAGQNATNKYWPDNREVRASLLTLPAYRRLSRARLRMVLEAAEDWTRGFTSQRSGETGQRVARGLTIEHLMPQSWEKHWPLNGVDVDSRAALIDTIGNLTLLTGKLNSANSNKAWLKKDGKRIEIRKKHALLLDTDLLETRSQWNEERIRQRSTQIASKLCRVWAVPKGHHSPGSAAATTVPRPQIRDLLAAGLLSVGTRLFAIPERQFGKEASVLADGTIEVNQIAYETPTAAATHLSGFPADGWGFWAVDAPSGPRLRDKVEAYADLLGVDVDE